MQKTTKCNPGAALASAAEAAACLLAAHAALMVFGVPGVAVATHPP